MADYVKEMQEHWARINKQSGGETFAPVICPGTWKRECKLCELSKKILFDKKNYPEGHTLRTKARELNRKNTYYSNIILVSSPLEIVVFEYGDKIFKRLLRFQMDPEFGDYKDFMHPMNGYNMLIDKIPAADKRQTDYAAEPRRASSPLMNAEVILKMLGDPRYNLSNIVENILNGKVKVFNQKKLPNGKTEIRILPSWLGPQYMSKFFEHVLVHYNISQEDFDRVQAGGYNPFIEEVTATPGKVLASPGQAVGSPEPHATEDPSGWSTWGKDNTALATPQAWGPSHMEVPVRSQPPVAQKESAGYTIPGGNSYSIPDAPQDAPNLTADGGPPICYGDYDPANPECTGPCSVDGWGQQCHKAYDTKRARREGARNVTPIRKL
jgi:hypothetical protein